MSARKMTLNRNHVLTSLYGHSIKFEKGVPTGVPPVCYAEVLAIGGEFADGEGLPPPPAPANAEPTDPNERAERIIAAVTAIAERNHNGDFSGSGVPKTEAVTAEAGFKVSGKDVAKAWQIRHDRIAEAKGLV
jgi:hypothetical protein